MFKNFFTLLSLFLSIVVFSQKNYWSATNSVKSKKLKERKSQPTDYKLYNLNLDGIKNALSDAPQRFSNNESLILKLPTSNGKMTDYVIQEASVMAPELQAKFPDIRSYVGYQKDNKANTVRFSVTPTDGINAMFFDGWNVSYLDNYTEDKTTYIVYKRKDLPANPEPFYCGFSEVNDADSGGFTPDLSLRDPLVRDGQFRTYRLALACTVEYATYHVNRAGVSGGTTAQKKEAVLAAMAASMTRVNGIYEKTVSLTMVMVPNNDQIIFLTAADYPSSGGYTNNNGSTMLNQNQTICNNIIGSANYDIGHVFSTGGGGIAQLQSPCGTSKARGVTGSSAPINDAFNVDYVAHEMGHQFGANHTFNATTDNCGGGNRNLSTAYEPGSGTTIMAYAGICGANNNVQNRSDAFFHPISVNEMYNFISRSNDCSAKASNVNQVPTANAGADYTIPFGTPFALTGVGTDPDGDELTYLWVQMDNQSSTQPPVSTATTGPIFRSYFPTISPTRYFPSMNYILANNMAYKWEMMPTVARTLNFRLLVNDNKETGNQAAIDDMKVTVANAGPFKVTSQTTNVEYDAATPITVTWDVAGTESAPIDTQYVQILLSKDGGATFTTVLADVRNSGSASVMLPNEDIASARLMVKAVDNIYFAVNSSPFKVKGFLAVNDINKKGFAIYPNPAKGEVTISLAKKATHADYIIYDASGRLLKTGKIPASEKVNVSELSSGVYRLVVSDNGETHSQNLIIKK